MKRGNGLALLLVATLASAGTPPWVAVEPGLVVALPRDHGSHEGFLTEWWYLTATLATADGGELGVQLTFFRRGLDPRPVGVGESALRARHLLAAHLAVTDLRRGRFISAQRVRRVDGALAGASTADLRVWLDGWELRREADDELVALAWDPVQRIAVQLRLRPTKPLVGHGVGGYSRKGPEPGNASAYLSWTRLAARGSLIVDGLVLPVDGAAWFDHEWGTTQLGASVVGWDWFGLRLADGRDLMVFLLRHADGTPDPYSAGTLVAGDGRAHPLALGEFTVEPLATWRSPRSGATYPARWRLVVPGAGLDLRVTPRLPDAELDARGSTGVVYWEGPVRVSGSVAGEGFAELTGYANSLAGAFAPPASAAPAP